MRRAGWLLIAGCSETATPTLCVGGAVACEAPLDEMVVLATHNAMSNAADGWAAPNQSVGIEAQLAAGVRGLLIDVYPDPEDPSSLALCHGYCELGSRPLGEALDGIRGWLAGHPTEIVVFVIEEHAPSTAIAAAFEAHGLAAWAIRRDDLDDPAGELLAGGPRVLITSEGGSVEDWYLDFWSIGQDTPYTFRGPEDLSCAPNRGSVENPFFLVNHWFGRPFPSPELAADANARLSARVAACEAERGRRAQLVAVDFFDIGPDPAAFLVRVDGG